MVRRATFIRGFDVDEITQIGWFRLMEEPIKRFEPMKRFECRSDVLRSTGDGASRCVLNLLEAFELYNGK